MLPVALHIPGSFLPFKLMLMRIFKFMLTAIINISELIVFNKPLKGLNIGYAFTKLKDHMQIIADPCKLAKNGISIVFIKI